MSVNVKLVGLLQSHCCHYDFYKLGITSFLRCLLRYQNIKKSEYLFIKYNVYLLKLKSLSIKLQTLIFQTRVYQFLIWFFILYFGCKDISLMRHLQLEWNRPQFFWFRFNCLMKSMSPYKQTWGKSYGIFTIPKIVSICNILPNNNFLVS